jgi:fatty acid desaturase
MDHATDHATDHRAFLARVPADLRQHLTRTRDAPGLARLALHSAAIATGMLWIGLGLPYWGLAIWPTGIALSFLFTLQHECTHRTPFRTPWLNEAVGHATGLLLFQPFGWFRAFHMAHHRYTNLPGQDPELDGDKPETWAAILWHLATPGYWAAKARVLGENAFASPTTSPASSTTIRSASTMVESRCAMVMTVRPWPIIAMAAPWIERSVSVSSALVASSSSRIGGSFSSVRAMPTRCFSPPESFRPRSPTWVS